MKTTAGANGYPSPLTPGLKDLASQTLSGPGIGIHAQTSKCCGSVPRVRSQTQVFDRSWRGEMAKVEGVHPHRFRHQFAHDWLAADQSETSLMRLAGWRSRQMVSRYAASAADERAHDAARRAMISAKY